MDLLTQYRSIGSWKEYRLLRDIKPKTRFHYNLLSSLVMLNHQASWKFFLCFVVLIRYCISTFTMAFEHSHSFGTRDVINITCDLIFLIDVFSVIVNRFVYIKTKKRIKKNTSMLKRYMWRNKALKPRPWFTIILDLISLFPYEWFRYVWTPHGLKHSFIHIVPVVRIYRISFLFISTSAFGSSMKKDVLQLLIKFFVLAVIIPHTLACLWYLMQDEAQRTSLFLAQERIKFDQSKPWHWYTLSVYFVLTVYTNIGFGDIYPNTDSERIVAMGIAMIGFAIINGYFIGTLSSVILEQNRKFSSLRLRLSLIQHELEERNVPTEIQKKIIRFYYASWMSRRGAGSDNEMLQGLPDSFSAQVYQDIFLPALNASLLFRRCDAYTKRAIIRLMKINLFMAGDVILKRNEMNSTMYYIRKGTIQIMSYQDDETEVMTFGAGTVFGQCALLLTLPAKSEVHAATFCEIHTLNRKDLFHSLMDYPSGKEIVLNVHKNLILNTLADKFLSMQMEEQVAPENVLTIKSFYKNPSEMSKLGRDDVCLVTTFPYIYMPDTKFLVCWNILVGIVTVVITFYFPLCAAFTRKYPVEQEAFIFFVEFVLIADVYLTLYTALHKENVLLSTWQAIFTEQLSHAGIYLDVIALLPLHYFMAHENRFKPVVLCLKCIKLYKIPILFAKAEYKLSRGMISVVRMVKYILYFVLGCYIMGTIYYMQACYYSVCKQDSWYANPPVTDLDENPVFVSLYFAIMVISGTGYGDITVSNITDILWVLSFIFPGVLLFCYLISEYSAYLSVVREPRQNFIELSERVNSFLTNNKILPSERIRVRNYLDLQWEKNMGYEFVFGHDLYYDTPPHLMSQVNLNSRSAGISKMEIFKGLGENVINAIHQTAIRGTFPPHEVVIYAGEICTSLIVLEAGYCEVTFGQDVSIKKIIGPGENICTVEFFLGLTSMTHVRTLTHCVIVKVFKNSIRRALVLNPAVNREMEHAIREFKQSEVAKNFCGTKLIRLHLAVRPPLKNSVYRFRYKQKEGGNQKLIEPYLKLGICQCIRFFLQNSTVLPYGKLLKRWELSRCFFAFCSALVFPPLPYLQLEIVQLYYVGWLLDIAAWIDLYFRLHVCYYNARKILVTHPLWTCGHYIKGSFALDFLFCFPFDRIMHRKVYDANGETNASETSIDILRILRVGQIHRIPSAMTSLGPDFLSTPSLFVITTMSVGFTIVYVSLLACIMVLVSVNYKIRRNGTYYPVFSHTSMGMNLTSELERFNFEPDPTKVMLLTLYWTGLTALSVGLGDIPATTTLQTIYVITVILISYLYFNYITIIIASCLSSINLNLTLYQKRLNHLINYLKSENIDPLLQKHTINHFEYVWKKTKGMEAEVVFANFNTSLKNDVTLHLYEETLRGVKAFKGLDPSFYRIISNRLKEGYYQSGASVYKCGDLISLIYLIHQGEVTIVGKQEDNTAVLWRSEVFGHLEPNTEKSVAYLSAVATRNLHVLTIPTVELFEMLGPKHTNLLIDLACEQYENMNHAPRTEPADDDMIFGTKKSMTSSTKTSFLKRTYQFTKAMKIVFLIVAFCSINLVTFHMAFQRYHFLMIGLNIPIELLYIFKIYLGFNAGFMSADGEFVTDLQAIRRRYLKSLEFYVDLITLIPFEVLAFAAPKKDQIFVATVLRMTKLLRVYDVWSYFNSKADTLNVNMVFIKLMNMGIVAAIIVHQASCAWYMVYCPRAYCPKSKTNEKLVVSGNCKDSYLCAVYFIVMILTTSALGEITPCTISEIWFILIIALIARIYAATFIGQMVSTIQKSLYAKTNYAFETETLKSYMVANDVPPQTIRMVLQYANDLWVNDKGYQIPELLRKAPLYLVSEIKVAAYGFHLRTNPVFKDCSPSFVKQLINALTRRVFFYGNIIVNEGTVDGTLYFVHSGQVGYTVQTITKEVRTRGVEKYFGLIEGFMKQPHKHTYFARSICIILTLSVKELENLIEFHLRDVQNLYSALKKLPSDDEPFMPLYQPHKKLRKRRVD